MTTNIKDLRAKATTAEDLKNPSGNTMEQMIETMFHLENHGIMVTNITMHGT